MSTTTKKPPSKKKKSKEPAQPRFILDGKILYIHVDDLIANLQDTRRLGVGLGPVVEVLRQWRDGKVKK